MRIDPLAGAILKTEKTNLALEAIGDGKIRVQTTSWEDHKVIGADEVLEIAAVGKTVYIFRKPRGERYHDKDPMSFVAAGNGPDDFA